MGEDTAVPFTGAEVAAVTSAGGEDSASPSPSTVPPSTTVPVVPPGEFPHVILETADWGIDYVVDSRGQAATGTGEYHSAEIGFTNSAAGWAELSLDGGVFADLGSLILDRENSGTRIADAPVLGVAAVVVLDDGDNEDHTAIWSINDVVYEFRAGVGEDTFRSLLASLTIVNQEDWTAALPDTVVTDRVVAVDEFLADIPLPEGFDPAPLAVGPAEDWYQVGADVVGSVTCAWIDQWVAGWDAGDEPLIDEAVAAMGTSHEWGILIEMDVEGGYARSYGNTPTAWPVTAPWLAAKYSPSPSPTSKLSAAPPAGK